MFLGKPEIVQGFLRLKINYTDDPSSTELHYAKNFSSTYPKSLHTKF